MTLPPGPPWHVISHWVTPSATESLQTVAFDTFEMARAEARRLGLLIGDIEDGRVLKSVALIGDFKAAWGTLDPTADPVAEFRG